MTSPIGFAIPLRVISKLTPSTRSTIPSPAADGSHLTELNLFGPSLP